MTTENEKFPSDTSEKYELMLKQYYKDIALSKDPEHNELNFGQYSPHGRTDSKKHQLSNGIIVIHDERPYIHPDPFMTIVLDPQNQDHILIHRGEINKILTVLQESSDPKKAMEALRRVVPPAYTKKQLETYQKWDRRNLKLKNHPLSNRPIEPFLKKD